MLGMEKMHAAFVKDEGNCRADRLPSRRQCQSLSPRSGCYVTLDELAALRNRQLQVKKLQKSGLEPDFEPHCSDAENCRNAFFDGAAAASSDDEYTSGWPAAHADSDTFSNVAGADDVAWGNRSHSGSTIPGSLHGTTDLAESEREDLSPSFSSTPWPDTDDEWERETADVQPSLATSGYTSGLDAQQHEEQQRQHYLSAIAALSQPLHVVGAPFAPPAYAPPPPPPQMAPPLPPCCVKPLAAKEPVMQDADASNRQEPVLTPATCSNFSDDSGDGVCVSVVDDGFLEAVAAELAVVFSASRIKVLAAQLMQGRPLRPVALSMRTNCTPLISLLDYLKRIHHWTKISREALIAAVIYLKRVSHNAPQAFAPNTLFRWTLTSIMVASKYQDGYDDSEWAIGAWANVGGVGEPELVNMERDMLSVIAWRLFISREEVASSPLVSQAGAARVDEFGFN